MAIRMADSCLRSADYGIEGQSALLAWWDSDTIIFTKSDILSPSLGCPA